MALAPTHPEWTLDAVPAKARTKLNMGNGITLPKPLRHSGNTAPDAKRAVSSRVAVKCRRKRLGVSPTANAPPPT